MDLKHFRKHVDTRMTLIEAVMGCKSGHAKCDECRSNHGGLCIFYEFTVVVSSLDCFKNDLLNVLGEDL